MNSKYIKSYLRMLLFVPLTLVMTNCSEEWLEPKPLSIFTPENAFVDSRGMYGALTACERNIRYEFYSDGARQFNQLGSLHF